MKREKKEPEVYYQGLRDINRDSLGTIIGAGIAIAGGVATAAAIWRGRVPVSPHDSGVLPGYATYPGDLYDVCVERDGNSVVVRQAVGIWFVDQPDFCKYIYDLGRSQSMTVKGALIAVGHSRKAGVPSTGRKVFMRGFNTFGMKAGVGWRRDDKPYFMAGAQEFRGDQDTQTGEWVYEGVQGWRFYETPQEAVQDWLHTLSSLYPRSFEQLYDPTPSAQAYVDGLKAGVGGKQYATGAFNMKKYIDYGLNVVPGMLNQRFGYSLEV